MAFTTILGSVSVGVAMEADAGMTLHSQRWGHFWPNAQTILG